MGDEIQTDRNGFTWICGVLSNPDRDYVESNTEILRKSIRPENLIGGNTYNLIGRIFTGNKSRTKIVEATYLGWYKNGIIDEYVFEFKPKDTEYFLQFDYTDNENHRIISKDILRQIIVLC